MKKYNLGFIEDRVIYDYVKQTVQLYRTSIDLAKFNANIVDPIKLTFDSKIYGRDITRIIEDESARQNDKSNTNRIGYFHQNLFQYAGGGWIVPSKGFDVINEKRHIYVEIKNKHNTMNAAAAQRTYRKMQEQILKDDKATCMLVEVIAKHSQNFNWKISLDGEQRSHDRIRRVSIDKFYEIVFGDPKAFMKLCRALPDILDDVLADLHGGEIRNTVQVELGKISPDIFKSLYLRAFGTYEGFNEF